MKILFCLSHISKSLQWKWLAEELKTRGVKQVYVLIGDNKDDEFFFYEDLKTMGVEVYLLPHKGKMSYLKNIIRTRSLIRTHKTDIVHTSLPLGNIVGQTAAILAGAGNRITTCENVSWAHDFNNKKQKRIDNFTFSRSKRIIATSEIAADYLRKNWQFDQSKLRIIYHGLKPSDYQVSPERVEATRKKLKIDKQNEFVVGVVSRFEFWKGHEYIIEAANKLKEYPNIKFYIFGSKGSYFDEAEKRIEQYGLQQKVSYGGFVEDTSALYQLFDVHLHVPVNEHVETGGITILEGMMAGRPQVLTLSGYAWQTARHLQNAYVVPFKNSDAIAEAILWMKNNPDKANKLAGRAKEDSILFSVKKKTDQHIDLYNELLK
jgi:glycosyltransferase involved in cell wall biosynthesis